MRPVPILRGARSQQVGQLNLGPLPHSPNGTPGNPVVDEAHGIVILGGACRLHLVRREDGVPRPAIGPGNPRATVPKAVSVHRPAEVRAKASLSLVILEGGSVMM